MQLKHNQQIKQYKKEDYLLQLDQYQEQRDTCLICFQMVEYAVCCDSCKSFFCKVCASNWKHNIDKCPKKCSSPWKFNVLEKTIALKCPFNVNCKQLTSQSFYRHIENCLHNTNNIKQAIKTKRNYLCSQFHKLEFLRYKIDVEQQKCSECRTKFLCRSKCNICEIESRNSLYCGRCRTPPMRTNFCPVGIHKLLPKKVDSSHVCAICGVFLIYFQTTVAYDEICELTICQTCKVELVEDSQNRKKLN